jgi:DNA polymerase-3 subunit epsilon/oligoribonuclease
MKAVFLDSETNGLDPYKHRIIEIAFKIVNLANGDILFEYHSIVKQPESVWDKSDPKSLQINGHTKELNEQGTEEIKIKEMILNQFNHFQIERKKAIFICQNPSFDRSFFSQIVDPCIQEERKFPYHWLDLASMFFAFKMQEGQKEHSKLPWNLGLSKDEIAASYGLEKEKKPHMAMQGVEHLIQCFEKVIGLQIQPQLQR